MASLAEPPSLVGFSRTIKAARGVRLPFWRGTTKRPVKRRLWLEAGVNAKGHCVLRCFKNRDDQQSVGELNIMGPRLELKSIREVKDQVLRFCLMVRGADLTKGDTRELGTALYIYSTTHREDSIITNAIKVLAQCALASGMCRYATEVSDTFGGDPKRYHNSTSSNKSFSSISGRDFQDKLETMSAASNESSGSKRFRIRNALSFGKRRGSSSTAPPTAAAAAAAAAKARPHSASVEDALAASLASHKAAANGQRRNSGSSSGSVNLDDAASTRSGSFQRARDGSMRSTASVGISLSRKEQGSLVTAIQCCRFLFDFSDLKSHKVFRKLPPSAEQEAEDLRVRLVAASRPSLRGSTADVVAHVLASVLWKLRPALIASDVFYRYQTAISKQISLGIDPSMSQAAAKAASILVGSLPVPHVYVLREVIALFERAQGPNLDPVVAGRLLAGLLVENLRNFCQPAEELAFPLVRQECMETFEVLLRTLTNALTGPPIFETVLTAPAAVGIVSDLCATIPSHAPDDRCDVLDENSNTGPENRDFSHGATAAGLQGDFPQLHNAEALEEDDTFLTEEPLESASVDNDPTPPPSPRPPPPALVPIVAATTTAAVAAAESAAAVTEQGDEAQVERRSPPREVDATQLNGSSAASAATAVLATPQVKENSNTTASEDEAGRRLELHNEALEQLQAEDANLAALEYDPSFDKDRAAKLERLVRWYEARLESNPGSQNARLWERELEALSEELERVRHGIPEFQASMKHSTNESSVSGGANHSGPFGAATWASTEVLAKAWGLWMKTKRSTADMLIRKSAESDPAAILQAAKRIEDLDSKSHMDSDPVLQHPMAALDDSDELLERVLIEVNELHRTSREDEAKGARVSSTCDNGGGGGDEGESEMSSPSVDALLIALLRENVQLRLEVNEYQRGLVQRTADKAQQFEQQFSGTPPKHHVYEKSRPSTSPTVGPQDSMARKGSLTPTWSSFATMLGR